MSNRIIAFWRGGIKLWKTWTLGLAVLPLFSFAFIGIQEFMTENIGKSSSLPLYIDYCLILLFAVYCVFALVSIWRSGRIHKASRIWLLLSRTAGLLISMWFAGNMGLYIFVKTFIPPKIETQINVVPEKMKLAESSIEAETLYLGSYKLKFPLYRDEIKRIWPIFNDHRLISISISLNNGKGMISFDEIPDASPETNVSIKNMIVNWILNLSGYESYYKIIENVYYSRFRDYSWWNLRYNLRLSGNLMLKLMLMPVRKDYRVYAVETSWVRGYLRTGYSGRNSHFIGFDFTLQGRSNSFSVFTSDDQTRAKLMSMISTIEPNANIDAGYMAMEKQYRNPTKTGYPVELLLLSMLSIKGPSIETLNELLRIEKDIPDNKVFIDAIGQELNYLEGIRK